MSATRVAVLGAAGRMGSAVRAAVQAAPGLELVAAVDPTYAPGTAPPSTAPPSTAPGAVRAVAALGQLGAGEGIDVAVDFTTASAVLANAEWSAAHGVHLVCGTTGLGDAGVARLVELFGHGRGPNCVIAPNFAVSAVLMMRFAELAAPFFDGAEIVELHHDHKTDAPSGTAIETARRIAASRIASGAGPFVPDPTEQQLAGARGAAVSDGEVIVPVHAVRLAGLVAHQEVVLGATGQSLTIRQDSYDRSSFMPGVLLAVREVGGRPGVTFGLEPLLGI